MIVLRKFPLRFVSRCVTDVRIQIVYVFQGSGVTGRHAVLVASSIQVCY